MKTSEHGHDIITIGASSGGISPISEILSGLPRDLAAAIFIVVHIPAGSESNLPAIFARHSRLPAEHPRDGQIWQPGHIYVAPPDRHILVIDQHIRVVRGPRENRMRPSADALFRSAALSYGPRVIGVVLSGALSDGTAGLYAIKQQGGLAVVHDPDDAIMPSMPRSAMQHVDADYVLPASDIADTLVGLVRTPAPPSSDYPTPEGMRREVSMSLSGPAIEATNAHPPGKLVGFTCPECGGPLFALEDGDLLRLRCRQGHAYTGESALEGQDGKVEYALWTALETLRENALLSEQLAEHARRRGLDKVADRFDDRARERAYLAEVIRAALDEPGSVTAPDMVTPESSDLRPPTLQGIPQASQPGSEA